MEITLLVPTLNRSDFLIRQLNYYNAVGFKGTICIGDSSTAEHVERTRRVITALLGNLSIFYGEYPNLSESACVEKLLDHVSTDYAAIVEDDDFLVPSSLEQCVQFLYEHADYNAAHGVAAVIKAQAIGVQSSEAYGRLTGAGYYRQAVLEARSASQRLVDYLGNYSGSLWSSVQRVDSWRAMYKDISLVSSRTFAGELLPFCISVIQGKVKELDCLYLIRQVHEGQYLLPDNYDWITGPNWLPSYQLFRDRLSKELADQDGISLDDAREVVKEAFWSYLARSLNRKWEGRYGQAGAGYRQRLRQAARGVPGLRRTWSEFRSFLPGQNNRLSLPALLRRSSPYHADFMPVYGAITTGTVSTNGPP